MVSTSVLNVAQGGFNPAEEFQKIQARKQAVLRQQEAQQDEMTRYLAGKVDFKDFATGTAVDPIINDGLNNIMQKYMMRIKQNKGESLGSLLMDLNNDVSGLRTLSGAATQIRKNIETGVKTIGQQNPDVATVRLYNDAMIKAFYKTDPKTGQVTLKSTDELDPSADYTGQTISTSPQNYFDGNSNFVKYFKTLPKQETKSGVDAYTRAGVKEKGEWTAEINPLQEIIYEKDGVAKGTRLKSENVPLVINGKSFGTKVGLPQDVYDQFIANSQNKFYIDAEFNKQSQGKINPYSPEADDLKRILAYDMLKMYYPDNAGFSFKRSETKSPYIIKNELGISNSRSGGGESGGSSDTDYMHVFDDIDRVTLRDHKENLSYTGIKDLPTSAGDVMINIARKRLGVNTVNLGDLKLIRRDDGTIELWTARDVYSSNNNGQNVAKVANGNTKILTLDKKGVDIQTAKGQKERQQVLKGNTQSGKKEIKGF